MEFREQQNSCSFCFLALLMQLVSTEKDGGFCLLLSKWSRKCLSAHVLTQKAEAGGWWDDLWQKGCFHDDVLLRKKRAFESTADAAVKIPWKNFPESITFCLLCARKYPWTHFVAFDLPLFRRGHWNSSKWHCAPFSLLSPLHYFSTTYVITEKGFKLLSAPSLHLKFHPWKRG